KLDFRKFADGHVVTAAEVTTRSEEHTSELQSLTNLVCRLLLEKKKKINKVDSTRRGDPRTQSQSTSQPESKTAHPSRTLSYRCDRRMTVVCDIHMRDCNMLRSS